MEEFEKFLSQFFGQASQLCFDKAREILEKEKDIVKTGNLKLLISQLSNFIEAERSYYNLGFLSVKNKIFLRKDNSLRSMYESLKTELHHLEDGNDRNINAIITQFSQFLTARVQLVDLYEKMYVMGTGSKPVRYDDLLSQVEVIIEMHTFSFPHPTLAPVKAALTWECEVLKNLLGAQVELQVWNFVNSLMYLHSAHTQLCTWEKSLQGKESWKLGFGASFLKSGSHQSALSQWLCKLKCAIISKFSLYFYHTLEQQSSPHEMKTLLASKAAKITDYYQKLQSMQRRCMASGAMLVFETSGLPTWTGPGYQHPDRPLEPSTDNYTVMLHHPHFYPKSEQLTFIFQALSERSPDFVLAEKVRCAVKDNYTFYMSSIDPRVSLVLAFDYKKDEKETAIINHMNEFCSHLRYSKVFAALKVSK